MNDIYNFHNWLLLRREFTNILGKNYNNWYLSNVDINNLLLLYKNNDLQFFPTQNGLVPKKIPAILISYISNFEKYKVKHIYSRLKRLLKMKTNELKANSKYNYFLKYGKNKGIELYKEKINNSKENLENFIRRYRRNRRYKTI